MGLLGATGMAYAFHAACARLVRAPRPDGPLSESTRALVSRAFDGLSPARLLDAHVHLVGTGTGGSGCYVNQRMSEPFSHPGDYLKFAVYRDASGVDDERRGDLQYRERLVQLVGASRPRVRALLLAFDQAYDEQGVAHPELTEFYTPNAYALGLAEQHPAHFRGAASVHPYRRDALHALDEVRAAGAVAIKWLPNAMRIDPSSPRCDAYYDKLVELGLPLITHAGEEKAVHAEEAQRLGNPLHLRRALDRGVKVVVAHCASLGQNPDLDAEGHPLVDNFHLFTRLMSERQYEGRLFGDTSAMALVNRAGPALALALSRREWHPRLLHGSDYPLPAINALMQTRRLVELGLLTEPERTALNELDRHNPLLFDFVLKRCLAVRTEGGVQRFSDEVFQVPPGLFPLG